MIQQEAHEYKSPGVGGQTGDFTHLTYSPKRVGLRGGRASPLLESGKRGLHQEVGAEPADSGSANHAAFAVGNWNGGFGLQAHSLGAPSPIEDYLSVYQARHRAVMKQTAEAITNPGRPRGSVSVETIFPGQGEMARRMRNIDWWKTPLGSPDQWSPASCAGPRPGVAV